MDNLYQKYVPKFFEHIIGHDVPRKELQKRARDQNFSNVMLFSGISGIGKTVFSRIIAKSILCENLQDTGNPCNACAICISIDMEKPILNYKEYNASNLGIDDIRIIVENSMKSIGFSTSTKKVYYIDELQEMAVKSKVAVKNLLKVLEKPGTDNYWILGTMDLSKIPTAIRNRATSYNLHPLDILDIANHIKFIAEKEGYDIDGDKEKAEILFTIAESSNGSMRTAISLLERIIYSNITTSEVLLKELNLVLNDKVLEIVDSILQGNVFTFSDKITETILKQINFRLNIIYKKLSGYNLNKYQLNLIKDIKNYPLEIVEKTIISINELIKFPYLTDDLIVFTLLSIINKNKQNKIRKPRRLPSE